RPGMVDTSYGLNFHASSGILIGMNQVLEGKTVSINGVQTPVKSMVDGVTFLCRASDDTNCNPINPIIPVIKAGARGALVNSVGTRNSTTGGYSQCDPVVFDPRLSPPKVSSSSDAKSLVALGAFPGKQTGSEPHSQFM